MTRAVVICSLLGALLGGNHRASAAAVDVLDWDLGTGIRLDDVGNQTILRTTVQNPFVDTVNVLVSNSTAQSIYDVCWDAAGNFDFLIETEQSEQGNSLGYTTSIGSIQFIMPADSLLTLDAEFNYALGNGDREAYLRGAVYQTGVGFVELIEDFAIPIVGDSPTGTFAEQAVVPLDGGVEYELGYWFELDSYGGSPTSLSHGDGHMSFHIEPVPEPATGLLLVFAVAMPVFIRRSRHDERV